jgi:hypothetical protein
MKRLALCCIAAAAAVAAVAAAASFASAQTRASPPADHATASPHAPHLHTVADGRRTWIPVGSDDAFAAQCIKRAEESARKDKERPRSVRAWKASEDPVKPTQYDKDRIPSLEQMVVILLEVETSRGVVVDEWHCVMLNDGRTTIMRMQR